MGRTERVHAGRSLLPLFSPEPGHRLPLCTVSLAFSHVTISLHSILSDCVIVFQTDIHFFLPQPFLENILFAQSLIFSGSSWCS